MPTYKAGNEIDAFCTKCKMDLLHKIVAVVSGRPVRVECRTCMTSHNYRAAKGVREPGATPPVAPVRAAASATGSARAVSPRSKVTDDLPAMPPQDVHILVYKISERFRPEQWLQHKTFGIGVVVREVPPDKIEVRFGREYKTLVHGVVL
jgi:hypothetical protein